MSDGMDDPTYSRKKEENIYLYAIQGRYEDFFEDAKSLFSTALRETSDFLCFDVETLRSNPRLVKIIRYLVKPKISQMKFGQLAGLSSTSSYEKERPTTPRPETARKILEFGEDRFDERKVPWVFDYRPPKREELDKITTWICDRIADSDANTRYRNWRKEKQEDKISRKLQAAGLDRLDIPQNSSLDDLDKGTFASGINIAGKEADFVARPNQDDLILVEAKAIGVGVDAYKRITNINDKVGQWRQGVSQNVIAIAVLAGWIDENPQEALDNEISLVWDHQLYSLKEKAMDLLDSSQRGRHFQQIL